MKFLNSIIAISIASFLISNSANAMDLGQQDLYLPGTMLMENGEVICVMQTVGLLDASLISKHDSVLAMINEVRFGSDYVFPMAVKLSEEAILISTKDFARFVNQQTLFNIETAGLELLSELLKRGFGEDLALRFTHESFSSEYQHLNTNINRIKSLVSDVYLECEKETDSDQDLRLEISRRTNNTLLEILMEISDKIQLIQANPDAVNFKEAALLAANSILINQGGVTEYGEPGICMNVAKESLNLFKELFKHNQGFTQAKEAFLEYKNSIEQDASFELQQVLNELKNSLPLQTQQEIDRVLAE